MIGERKDIERYFNGHGPADGTALNCFTYSSLPVVKKFSKLSGVTTKHLASG